MQALSMAKAFGTPSTLNTKSSISFRHPLLSHSNRSHQLVTAALPRFNLPSSLQTSYKASPAAIKYVCRSQLVAASPAPPPEDSNSKRSSNSGFDKIGFAFLASGIINLDDVRAYLEENKADKNFRRTLPWKGLQRATTNGSHLCEWLRYHTSQGKFPPAVTLPLSLKRNLRYGENPHQKAALYVDKSLYEVDGGGIAKAVQLHGKEMSANNYLDADAAWNCVCDFDEPTCVIVKHENPCGVASRDVIVEAYKLAVQGDPLSAYGGIVAFNVVVDEALAQQIREFRSPLNGQRMFYEVVVAPGFTEKGLEILRGKSKDLRVMVAKKNKKGKPTYRRIGGGMLVQEPDELTFDDIQFKVVSNKCPSEKELDDIKFAWICAKHLKSNAIVVAKAWGVNSRTVGIIAMRKAGEELKGAIVASDAFFPFAWNDAVEEACKSGVAAIVQPGGSIRDGDAIECCNKYNVALVFTGIRHFQH